MQRQNDFNTLNVYTDLLFEQLVIEGQQREKETETHLNSLFTPFRGSDTCRGYF